MPEPTRIPRRDEPIPIRRREPTPEDVDAFMRRLGRWLADVAMNDPVAVESRARRARQ